MEATPEQSAEGLAIVRVLSAVLDRLVFANAPIARSDPGQVTKFHAMNAPGIAVQQYLERIHKYASCSNECFILALIYIDRLIQRNNFLLTDLNVHRVVITAILLAAKFFDDAYYNNAYYAKVGGVLVSEMNGLEVDFLFRINFSLHVPPDVFDKYRAELLTHSQAATVSPTPPSPALSAAVHPSQQLIHQVTAAAAAASTLQRVSPHHQQVTAIVPQSVACNAPMPIPYAESLEQHARQQQSRFRSVLEQHVVPSHITPSPPLDAGGNHMNCEPSTQVNSSMNLVVTDTAKPTFTAEYFTPATSQHERPQSLPYIKPAFTSVPPPTAPLRSQPTPSAITMHLCAQGSFSAPPTIFSAGTPSCTIPVQPDDYNIVMAAAGVVGHPSFYGCQPGVSQGTAPFVGPAMVGSAVPQTAAANLLHHAAAAVQVGGFVPHNTLVTAAAANVHPTIYHHHHHHLGRDTGNGFSTSPAQQVLAGLSGLRT